MVYLPEGYWIDVTEVTQGQYQAWLATGPSTAGQAASCTWNTTYQPSATCMAPVDQACHLQCSERPQVCVDQCDAKAYCLSVGKRLCGQIGGGSLDFPVWYAHASFDQWYNACSSHGVKDYPYGDTYDAQTCVTGWGDGEGAMPVGSAPGCQAASPYAGPLDLAGNVAEWEDACEIGDLASTPCFVRGGDHRYVDPYQSRCDHDKRVRRDTTDAYTGFRCCKD